MSDEFIRTYLNNPEEMESRDHFTAEEKARLFKIEEFFVRIKFEDWGLQALDHEEEIAELIDSLIVGSSRTDHVKDASGAVQQILTALTTMDPSRRNPLPRSLQKVIENDFRSEESIPSIIVRLTAEGMKVLKSTIEGIELYPEPIPAVRSAASQDAAVRVVQEIDGMPIESRIHSGGSGNMTFELIFPEKTGNWRVTLKNGERLVSSEIVSNEEHRVEFPCLSEGEYTVELSGLVNHQFYIYLENDIR